MSLPTIEPEAEAILTALKGLLRERRIGYQQLADKMEVSLPTVKRMLNKTTLPLDRLLRICRIAEVDPQEVFERAVHNRPKHTMFTDEQDLLFYEQPAFLHYLKRLIHDGESPAQIESSEKLTPFSTEQYLSGLERVGLLERQTGTEIKLKIEPPIGFAHNSRVLRAEHTRLLEDTVKQVLAPDPQRVFAILKPLRLTDTQINELIEELTTIIDRFSYISEHSPSNSAAPPNGWNLTTSLSPATEEPRAKILNLSE